MRITNYTGLPAPLVRAVDVPSRVYPPKTVSVTTLTRPAQIQGLLKIHEDKITEDAADRMWALLGTLLHDVLERHAEGLQDTIAEQRLELQIEDWTITGKYDLSELILEGETLTDWKLTSIYALKDNDAKPEWEAQLNCYIALLKYHGRNVTKAQIVAIGRDWSKMRAKRESDYPQKAVAIKAIPIWEPNKTFAYMKHRLMLYKQAQDGIWPDCTPEERWARPAKWAIMKKGNKKASKLCDSEKDAHGWLDQILGGKANYSIQFRAGESIRCANYCPVARHCKQWAKLNPTLSDTLRESIKVAQQQKETT